MSNILIERKELEDILTNWGFLKYIDRLYEEINSDKPQENFIQGNTLEEKNYLSIKYLLCLYKSFHYLLLEQKNDAIKEILQLEKFSFGYHLGRLTATYCSEVDTILNYFDKVIYSENCNIS